MQNRRKLLCFFFIFSQCAGCTSSLFDKDVSEADVPVEEIDSTRLVGDVARASGFRSAKVRGFALVTNLRGTGSDPDPSGPKDMLIDDMRRREVEDPHQLLAKTSNSLVTVEAVLPPAAQKGDRIDVKVSTFPRSKTTDLNNGWLMKSRLQEMAVLDQKIRSGRVIALAQGAVLTDAMLNGETSDVARLRGRVLGGGFVTKERKLGLALRKDSHSFTMSRMIGEAINQRFHAYDRGIKHGAATPKRDSFIELAIQPQYRNNLIRYVRVIESLAIRESDAKKLERISLLRTKLSDPATCQSAALQMEAIGHEASAALQSGLSAHDKLCQFYCAEALAYLNHEAAVEILKIGAIEEPSLRWRALTALSAMTKHPAREALGELMHVDSAETRYGAFHALQDANPRDPAVQGENLNDVLALHVVPTEAPAMVHIRKTEKPEIVIFGSEIKLLMPFIASAGKEIMLTGRGSKIQVTHFGKTDDQTVVCPNNLTEILRAIVHVGGDYAEVVGFINNVTERTDNRQPSLDCRVEFDAIPKTGRKFNREESEPRPVADDQLAVAE